MVEPAPDVGVERRLDDATRQDNRPPANSASLTDRSLRAADDVLDPDAEALERQAADVRIVAHLIAGEADAEEGVVDAEIVQRLYHEWLQVEPTRIEIGDDPGGWSAPWP